MCSIFMAITEWTPPVRSTHDKAYDAAKYLSRFVRLMINSGFKNMTFMAHSMGTRVICEAMQLLVKEYTKGKIKFKLEQMSNVKMLCVAGEADEKDLENVIKSPLGGIIHVVNYFKTKGDWALWWAETIGLNDRKGAIGTHAVLKGEQGKHFFNINCNDTGIGHGYQTNKTFMEKELKAIIMQNKVRPQERSNLQRKMNDENVWIFTKL